MGATPDERLLGLFASVETLIVIYLKIAQLNLRFHEAFEQGSLSNSLFV
jgi:hypothetical protein